MTLNSAMAAAAAVAVPGSAEAEAVPKSLAAESRLLKNKSTVPSIRHRPLHPATCS
jgi:hypothetical protein